MGRCQVLARTGGDMKPTKVSLLVSCMFAALVSVPSYAQGLPKTGTIKIHTGWKIGSEVFEAPDNRSVGHGSVVGVNFNDAGAGPLHNGPAICVFTFLGAKDSSMNKGYCAFGDEDGVARVGAHAPQRSELTDESIADRGQLGWAGRLAVHVCRG